MKCNVTMFAVLVALGACQYPTYLPPIDIGLVDVHVMGSEPVRDAVIEIWRLDEDGERIGSAVAVCDGQIDECEVEDGRYSIEVGDLVPPYLVTVRRGTTSEFWAGEDVTLGEQVHLQAVVTRWIRRQTGAVVVSPLSTVAKALADRRFDLGMAPTYIDAADQAREVLGAHFGIDPIRTIPASRMDASLTEDVRYALALVGLSSITAEFAERSRRSIQSMNILMVTDALVRDVHGPGAALDGLSVMGPIELDSCTPEPCLLSANTLRAELVRALASRYLPSEANLTGLDYGDAVEFFEQLAGNVEPSLFGGDPVEPIDVVPPVVVMSPSPLFDETRDVIDFDPERRPSHVHDQSAVIDLANDFGVSCPQVHKHTNLLCSADDNPLEWRFVVRDDVAGVRDADVKAFVGSWPDVAFMTEVEVIRIGERQDGVEYAFRALCADLPALKTTEGRFFVLVQVEDWTGNAAAPLVGCWDHVPRAAPLWVGAPVMSTGPGSLDAARLENNNLAELLRGAVTPAEPRALIEFEVNNNSGDDVYLTLDILDVMGTYARTWVESRAFLRSDSTKSQCLNAPNPCSDDPPALPYSDTASGSDLSNVLPLQWRVINQATGLEEFCPECRLNEIRLRRYGRFSFQVATSDLGWLLPGYVDPLKIAEFMVGPSGSASRLTGVDNGEYVYCLQPMGSECWEHEFYQLYGALSYATLDLQTLRMAGTTSVSSTSIPRRPAFPARPFDRTFAGPLSANSFWTTSDVLPTLDSF